MISRRIAVVLVAHGEAETAGFIENYRVSLHTLGRASAIIPIPAPLRHFISFSSSLKKRLAGGRSGSPQNRLTRIQAERLQEHLDQMSSPQLRYEVMASFSASEPSVEAVLDSTRDHDGRIVVPMAPVDNAMSCGMLCDHLSQASSSLELSRTRVIGSLWRDERLYHSVLDHLFTSSRAAHSCAKAERVLMLLFHGTLIADRNGAAPLFRNGHEESLEFSRRLTSLIESDGRNPWGRVITAFLNHDVGGRWSTPSFEDACRLLDQGGYRNVSLFAAGYFSDGNETVHRGAQLAAEKPGLQVETISCMNDSPGLITCLAGKVVAATRQILVFSGDSTVTVV